MLTFNVLLKNISEIKVHSLFIITNTYLLFRRVITSEKRENVCNLKKIVFHQ